MVSPQTIKYNDVDINDYLNFDSSDVILDVAFESDSGAMSSFLNRSAIASESHDGRYKNTAKYKYDELFSPQFTIIKKDFSDFTQSEVRKVLKYLTQTDRPTLLEVYYNDANDDNDDNADVNWACIGGWTSIETYKISNSRTVGIVAKFEAITPYAISMLYEWSEDDGLILIDTDDNQPVYPKITIQQTGTVISIDGELTEDDEMIENTVYSHKTNDNTTYYWKSTTSDLCVGTTPPEYDGWTTVIVDTAYASTDKLEDKKIYEYTSGKNKIYRWIDPYVFKSSIENPNLSTTGVKISNTHGEDINPMGTLDALVVKNNNSTETITIDCANKVISSSNINRVFGSDFNWKWLELFDGENTITVEGNCTVQIEYREVRKLGEY